ncbi:hypothetical protein Mapa_001638 [Marchantia paleacea]|nr:hypothetical protein Mapa_001638 [Marchantia paleacea]
MILALGERGRESDSRNAPASWRIIELLAFRIFPRVQNAGIFPRVQDVTNS